MLKNCVNYKNVNLILLSSLKFTKLINFEKTNYLNQFRLNTNFSKYNFCTENEILKLNEFFPKNNSNQTELSFNSYFEKKSKEAADLLKVLNNQFDILDIENLIKTLLLCGHFKNYPQELLKKLDKRMSKLISNMKEEQVTRVIFGFTLLNHKSTSINFVIERILNRNLLSYNKNSFITIFKCFGKNSDNFISQNLFYTLRSYINKNINKFTLNELCDVFLNYPKILKVVPQIEDIELFNKLFMQIFPFYDKLDINRLVNFYFLIYSDKKANKIISSLIQNLNYEYEEKFINLFTNLEREKEFNNKLIYLIILTHHFANEKIIKYNFLKNFNKSNYFLNDFIHKKIIENLSLFTPEEINSIILVLTQNKQTFKFSEFNLKDIKINFINLVKTEKDKMIVDEILLYMQSILILIKDEKTINETSSVTNQISSLNNDFKNVLNLLQEELINKKLSSIGVYQCASLLELIHHFKSTLPVKEFFYKINLDILTQHLLRIISIKTEDDIFVIFDDYYLILLFLYDLRYSNLNFWTEFLKYSILFYSKDKPYSQEFNNINNLTTSRDIKLEKLKILIDLVKKELILN